MLKGASRAVVTKISSDGHHNRSSSADLWTFHPTAKFLVSNRLEVRVPAMRIRFRIVAYKYEKDRTDTNYYIRITSAIVTQKLGERAA